MLRVFPPTFFPRTITLTFGDCGENNPGMQKIGQKSSSGYSIENLLTTKSLFEDDGVSCEYYDLNQLIHGRGDEAGVLVIRGGLFKIYEQTEFTVFNLFEEQEQIDYDKKAYMRGGVKNKHARFNVCFSNNSQDPDYENKKGRIISFDSVPILNILRTNLQKYFPFVQISELVIESNYYYDNTKTGIGFHGDGERRKVIGIRLGGSTHLAYRWYQNSEIVGDKIMIMLNHGDIYIMSEKAVGTDWLSRSKLTLRHAAGCSKYTS